MSDMSKYTTQQLLVYKDKFERSTRYDLSVYSIVKYFHLAMENNPNMLDSLFTDRTQVIHSTPLSEMVRERRRLFLHKGAWIKHKSYSYSQLSKISNQADAVKRIRTFETAHGIPHETTHQNYLDAEKGVYDNRIELAMLSPAELAEYGQMWQAGLNDSKDAKGSKRFPSRKRFGYDTKFAVHLVRLLQQVEQILLEGDIDLRRSADMLKDVRAGNWTEAQVREWFTRREKEIEPLYLSSNAIPHAPNEGAIKALLLECLEHHYGNLKDAVVVVGRAEQMLRDIRAILDRG